MVNDDAENLKSEFEKSSEARDSNKGKLKNLLQHYSSKEFPELLQVACNSLSPHPIDAVRIPLIQLLNNVHNYIGAPITSFHINRDLQSQYPTQTAKCLILAVAIAVAQDQIKRKQLLENPQFLKELSEWLGLDKFDIALQHDGRNIILTDGKVVENIYTVPTENQIIPADELEETVKELASATKELNDVMIAHTKEIFNWHADPENAIAVSIELAQPIVESIEHGINELKNVAGEEDDPELKQALLDFSDAAAVKLKNTQKDTEDQLKGAKPPSDKTLEMINRSRKEAGLDEIKEPILQNTAILDMKQTFITEEKISAHKDTHSTLEEAYEIAKDVTLANSEKREKFNTLVKQLNSSPSSSAATPSFTKARAKIQNRLKSSLYEQQNKELYEVRERVNNLKAKTADIGRQKISSPKIDD